MSRIDTSEVPAILPSRILIRTSLPPGDDPCVRMFRKKLHWLLKRFLHYNNFQYHTCTSSPFQNQVPALLETIDQSLRCQWIFVKSNSCRMQDGISDCRCTRDRRRLTQRLISIWSDRIIQFHKICLESPVYRAWSSVCSPEDFHSAAVLSSHPECSCSLIP